MGKYGTINHKNAECSDDSMEFNEKQVQSSKSANKSESVQTDYSIPSKKLMGDYYK